MNRSLLNYSVMVSIVLTWLSLLTDVSAYPQEEPAVGAPLTATGRLEALIGEITAGSGILGAMAVGRHFYRLEPDSGAAAGRRAYGGASSQGSGIPRSIIGPMMEVVR